MCDLFFKCGLQKVLVTLLGISIGILAFRILLSFLNSWLERAFLQKRVSSSAICTVLSAMIANKFNSSHRDSNCLKHLLSPNYHC